MAFDFGSDILVDAMRAADPGKVAEARLKLERFADGVAASSSGSLADSLPTSKFKTELTERLSSKPSGGSDFEAMQKFESVVLSTFVQAMMPKEVSSVFGGGLAGDMWKAQMAEKIAEQMSKNGGIGIASRLLKDFQQGDDGIVPLAGLRDPANALQNTRPADAATQFLQKNELEALLKSSHVEAHNAIVVADDPIAVS